MNDKWPTIWKQLLDNDLVEGEPGDLGDEPAPWYVTGLLAVTGWLAAVFLLAAVVVGFYLILDNSVLCIVVGGGVIAFALYLLSMQKNDFLDNFALAISLAGQALVIWGLYRAMQGNQTMVLLSIAALHGILVLVAGNFVHRILSTLFLTYTLVALIVYLGWPSSLINLLLVPCTLAWLHEFDRPQSMQLRRAVGYGLAIGLVTVNAIFMVETSSFQSILWQHNVADLAGALPWMANAITGIVLVYVAWFCLSRYSQTPLSSTAIMALVATTIVAVIAIPAYGVSLGVVMVLLAFLGSNRALMGIGIVSLIAYTMAYYYFLDISLLYKSILLIVLGIILLLGRYAVSQISVRSSDASGA